jgi:hypothetical protein
VILTGDAIIDASVFNDCLDFKKVVWIEDDVQTIIGSTSETVAIQKDRNLLFREQELRFNDPKKANRTVNLILQLPTFAPVSCKDFSHKRVQLTYNSDGVEVLTEDEGEKVYPLEVGVFDLFSVELVLRVLPLEIGYKTQLKAFNHMVNDTVLVRIEVIELHKVWNGERLVDAWCVPVFIGEQLQTYWISKDKSELLKQSVKLGENKFFEFIR